MLLHTAFSFTNTSTEEIDNKFTDKKKIMIHEIHKVLQKDGQN